MGHIQSQYAESATKKFPHYDTYAKCQSAAFVSGMISLVCGVSGIYIAQEVFRKFRPISTKAILFAPVFGGSALGYIVTTRKTKACQSMWLALEEKNE